MAAAPTQAGKGGGTTVADGVLRCWTNAKRQNGWMLGYPDHNDFKHGEDNYSGGECLQIARIAEKQWRFSGSSECKATRWNVVSGEISRPDGARWQRIAPFSVVFTQR